MRLHRIPSTLSCEDLGPVFRENEAFGGKNEQSDETPAGASFEVLIRRIADGSDTAVWELLNRYSTNILRVVRRHLAPQLRPKIDSADIVQSVWKSLLRKGAAFDHIGSAEQFVAYIAGMARNKVLETHRHYTKQAQSNIRREVPLQGAPKHDGSDESPTRDIIDSRTDEPSEIAHARERWEFAMMNAGERGQRIVRLRLQGMTLEEIADEVGLSKMTVRRTLASVLISLST